MSSAAKGRTHASAAARSPRGSRRPRGVRALVHAEAVTWATQLLGALDWARLGRSASVGGPTSGGTTAGCAHPARPLGSAHSARRSGRRGSWRPSPVLRAERTSWEEQSRRAGPQCSGLGARCPDGPPPVRVAGWWPESGRALIVPVDGALLEATMTRSRRGRGGTRSGWLVGRRAAIRASCLEDTRSGTKVEQAMATRDDIRNVAIVAHVDTARPHWSTPCSGRRRIPSERGRERTSPRLGRSRA